MKIKLIIAVCLFSILFTACGTVNQDNSTLADIENYMMSHGLLEGERIEPIAIMIGAVRGFKYLESGVEVYEYDIKSDIYKSVAKTKKVAVEGFGMDMPVAAVNGKYVLFYQGQVDSVVEVFKEFDYRDAPISEAKRNESIQSQHDLAPDQEEVAQQAIEFFFASEEASPQLSYTEIEPIVEPVPEPTVIPTPLPTKTPTPTTKPEEYAIYEEEIVYYHDTSEDDNYYDYSVLDLDDAVDLAERNYLDNFSKLDPNIEYEIIYEEVETYDEEALAETIYKMQKYGFASSESMDSEFGKAYMKFCDAWISERELKNSYLISVVQSISDNKLYLIIDVDNKYIIDAPSKLVSGTIYTDGEVQYQYLDKFENNGESRSLNQIYFNRSDLLKKGIID